MQISETEREILITALNIVKKLITGEETEKEQIIVKEKLNQRILLNTICIKYGVTVDEVKSRSKKEEYHKCRRLFCYFACEYLKNLSHTEIGKMIGRDHTAATRNKNIILRDIEIYSDKREEYKNMRNYIEKYYTIEVFSTYRSHVLSKKRYGVIQYLGTHV